MKLTDEEYEIQMYMLGLMADRYNSAGQMWLTDEHHHTISEHINNMIHILKKEREQTGEVNVI